MKEVVPESVARSPVSSHPIIIVIMHPAESRISVGITVFGGMTAACIFGTLLVPSFYVIIQSITDKFMGNKTSQREDEEKI